MLISTENLTFGFNGETLLEQISFALNEGDRVGLIGGNGEGKTTLIRLLWNLMRIVKEMVTL